MLMLGTGAVSLGSGYSSGHSRVGWASVMRVTGLAVVASGALAAASLGAHQP